MFDSPSVPRLLARILVTPFGRTRRAALPRPSDRTRARFQLEGLEDRRLLSITEFPIYSTNPNGGHGPLGITAGPDGNLWCAVESLGGGYIGMINPTTDAITEFPLPTAPDQPADMTAGPDGNLWSAVHLGHMFGMINPTTHAITEFGAGTVGFWKGITAGPDGNLWSADPFANNIGMINPTTDSITEFTPPTANSSPWDITAGPDGNLWFTEESASKIGMINPTTDVITEFATPTALADPEFITAGPDGNLWFTENGSLSGQSNVSQIGMINPTTHAITEFPTPSSPDGITAGPDGNLWFTAGGGNIGTINPTTHAVTEDAVPYTNSGPWDITAGPDGNLWFTDFDGNSSIGVVTLNGTQFVLTQQPPASTTAGAPFGLTVEAEDSSGKLDSSFNGTVTVALANNPTGARLGGTLSVTANQGVANFSDLSLTKAASGYTLQVSSNGVTSATTSAITVTAATASQLVIGTQPSAMATAGVAFGTQPVIDEKDQFGNLETSDNSTVVTATLNSGTGPLQGTTTVTVSGGVATFTNLADNKAETISLNFTSGSLTNATSNSIVVSPATASSLAFSGLPGTVTAGTAFNFTVTAYDAYDNVATGYAGTVHFTSSDTAATLPHNSTFTSGDAGTQSFSATLNTSGTQTITAADTVTSSIAGQGSVSVASATFLKMDTTTEGSWIGVYGSQGYNIINSGVSYPSYATVTPAGNASYTWAAHTNLVQALQNPSGSGRIAACWYTVPGTNNFTVDVDLTDGQAHNLELYLLDYGSTSRSENIVFTDANTHAVLSTQSASSFANGVYMDYTISGNVLITITKTGGANAVLSGLFFNPTAFPATTGVTSSLNPSTTGQSVTFTATVSDPIGGVPTGSVEFYDGSTDLGSGSTLSGSGNSATSTFTTSMLTAGSHSISADYTPTGEFADSSGSLTQTVNIPPATASYLGADPNTEGSWIGVYGSQGYNVINATNGVAYPSYATVTTARNTPYTWSNNTNLVSALKNPSGSGRIAACWYTAPGITSFTVDVDLTDGLSHNLELYLLDFGSTSRSEQIVFSDANTHAVLSTQNVSSFQNGVYMNYTIFGNVLITITKTGGANAVLSGLFFDPPPAPPAIVRGGNSTGGLGDTTGVSTRLETDPIGTPDPPPAPRSSVSTTARLSVHDAALLSIGISTSSNPVTNPIGTVDPSGDDPAAPSLSAEPFNPNAKLVYDLALEQVSVGQTRSRARFGQKVVEWMNDEG